MSEDDSIAGLLRTVRKEIARCAEHLDQQGRQLDRIEKALTLQGTERIEKVRKEAGEKIKVGLDRARAKGVHLGRPALDEDLASAILTDLRAGVSFRKVAAKHGIALSTVQRVSRQGNHS